MAQRDYESITVADTAIGFTAAKLKNSDDVRAEKVFLTLEDGQIRFRYDGTDPTSSEGHIMNAGDVVTLDEHQDIINFKAIRTGSTSGTLKTTYKYGR